MAFYKFITWWEIDAPVDPVWKLIQDAPRWHEWWHGVLEVKELHRGDAGYEGTSFAHTWRSFLPYKLEFITKITEVIPLKTICADVTGELEGTGRWEFIQNGNGKTIVVYYWFVKTTRAWMNLTAPFLGGVFRWNHDTVMKWGCEGAGKMLNCRTSFRSEWVH
jgi:hypothetical protein